MAIAGFSPIIRPTIPPRTPQGAFSNEPFTDFSDPENARAMHFALDKVASHLGAEYSLIIGGERLQTPDKISLHQSCAPGANRRRPPEGRRRASRTPP
ncbi:MAG: hypothetical protein WDM87_06970 [Terracidiphilus sp.]